MIAIVIIAVMGAGCVSFSPVPEGQISKDYEQNTQGAVIAEEHYTGTVREVTVWDYWANGIIGYKVITDDRTIFFSESTFRLYGGHSEIYSDHRYALVKNSFQGRNLTVGTPHEWIFRMHSNSKYYVLIDVVPVKTITNQT